MKKGTVYFFTGLAGAGKTTIGGLFYEKLKQIHPNAILADGDVSRAKTGHKDYSTESRREGAFRGFRQWRDIALRGMDVVVCSIAMYEDVRAWNRANIENYKEIYIKASMETLYRRNQKGLYSPGVKQVVGVDLPWDEPKAPDVVVHNEGDIDPAVIVDELVKKLLEN